MNDLKCIEAMQDFEQEICGSYENYEKLETVYKCCFSIKGDLFECLHDNKQLLEDFLDEYLTLLGSVIMDMELEVKINYREERNRIIEKGEKQAIGRLEEQYNYLLNHHEKLFTKLYNARTYGVNSFFEVVC